MLRQRGPPGALLWLALPLPLSLLLERATLQPRAQCLGHTILPGAGLEKAGPPHTLQVLTHKVG